MHPSVPENQQILPQTTSHILHGEPFPSCANASTLAKESLDNLLLCEFKLTFHAAMAAIADTAIPPKNFFFINFNFKLLINYFL
jgi:hypothetical protein